MHKQTELRHCHLYQNFSSLIQCDSGKCGISLRSIQLTGLLLQSDFRFGLDPEKELMRITWTFFYKPDVHSVNKKTASKHWAILARTAKQLAHKLTDNQSDRTQQLVQFTLVFANESNHWCVTTCDGTAFGGSMRIAGSHSPGGSTVTQSRNSSMPARRSLRSRALYATSWNIYNSTTTTITTKKAALQDTPDKITPPLGDLGPHLKDSLGPAKSTSQMASWSLHSRADVRLNFLIAINLAIKKI